MFFFKSKLMTTYCSFPRQPFFMSNVNKEILKYDTLQEFSSSAAGVVVSWKIPILSTRVRFPGGATSFLKTKKDWNIKCLGALTFFTHVSVLQLTRSWQLSHKQQHVECITTRKKNDAAERSSVDHPSFSFWNNRPCSQVSIAVQNNNNNELEKKGSLFPLSKKYRHCRRVRRSLHPKPD